MTIIVLITKNRLELLKRTVDALSWSDLTDTKLYVVDNGSNDGTVKYLRDLSTTTELFEEIILNDHDVPQWQKSYAIRQVQDIARKKHADFKYFGWLDDDMVVKPDWLVCGRKVLDHISTVEVASMHQDELQEKRHKTVKTKMLGDLEVRIKRSANGACWLVRRGFFNKYGLPPVSGGSVMYCKKDDDTYNRRLKGRQCFGVIDKSKHIGYQNSLRKRAMRRKK